MSDAEQTPSAEEMQQQLADAVTAKEAAVDKAVFEPPKGALVELRNKLRLVLINFVDKTDLDNVERGLEQQASVDDDPDADVDDKQAANSAQKIEAKSSGQKAVPFCHFEIDPRKVKQSDWVPVKALKGDAEWILIHKESAKFLSGYSLEMRTRAAPSRPTVREVLAIYAMPSGASERKLVESRNQMCTFCSATPSWMVCACGLPFCDDVCIGDARRYAQHTEAQCRKNVAGKIATDIAQSRDDLNAIKAAVDEQSKKWTKEHGDTVPASVEQFFSVQ